MKLSRKPSFKHQLLYSFIILAIQSAHAGVVRDDVDYQQFRDFAENKGKFAVGEKDKPIPILGKKGEQLGTILGNGIPMPDWSAVNTRGTVDSQGKGYVIENGYFIFHPITKGHATLINPQYVTGVDHVGIAQHIGFGDVNHMDHKDEPHYVYNLIKRNPFSETGATNATTDYYQPRLNKLVTEVAPIETVNGQHGFQSQTEIDEFKKRYPLLLRMGSGYQVGVTGETGTHLADGYQFLTGGQLAELINSLQTDTINVTGKPTDENQPAMISYGASGDSGSPIYAYDSQDKKWKLLASWQGNITHGTTVDNILDQSKRRDYYATLNKNEFNQEKQKEDNNKDNIQNTQLGSEFNWVGNSNISTISSNGKQFDLPIYDENAITDIKSKLNHGKNLTISGKQGVLNLKSDINQGAGALHFETDFTVKADTPDTTWLGAGVSVAKDKTVTWQVKNPENDRLSKIGQGTLLVNGTGDNKGDISVGDGTVILNQKDGQAFNQVGIVSGRPTVQLANDKQVNPNNIYFGYRGGRLNVNGNNLSFDYIRNIDEGAMIVNHHANQAATVTIKTDASDKNKAAFNGVLGETDTNRHNGQLNVVYTPNQPSGNQPFLLSGGMNLNGNLTVDSGSLLLSGRPTPHAYDHIKQFEPFQDNDWINRHFKATNMMVQNDSKLTIGRNVDQVNANITVKDNATAQLGFINGKTPVCVRSDYFGTTNCEENKSYQDTSILDAIPNTKITGNLQLNDNANVILGKAHLTGQSVSNGNTNTLTLSPTAKWTMTANSSVGNLHMEKGAAITLNPQLEKDTDQAKTAATKFNTLTIKGNLSGKGQFNYATDLSGNQGDKVAVEGIASGSYILNVKDSGKEPNNKNLVLMDLQNAGQPETGLEVELNSNGQKYVDLGAWRYELKRQSNQFVLAGKENSTPSATQPPVTQPPATQPPVTQPPVTQPPVTQPPVTQPITPTQQNISKYTNTALSKQSAHIDGSLKTIQRLNQRLWDSHPKSRGIWFNGEYTKQKNQADIYRPYEQTHRFMQIGADKEMPLQNSTMLLGVALSHTDSQQDFAEGSGKGHLTVGSIYSKWLSPKHSFITFDTGYGVDKQKIVLDNITTTHRQNVAHLGVSVGKTWRWGDFEAQPAIGARYHYFSGGQYQLNGASIQDSSVNVMAYQPNLRFSHAFKTAAGVGIKPYLATTYTHLSGRGNVDVNYYRFTLPMNHTWQHQAGFTVHKGHWSAEMYTKYEHGKKHNTGHSAGVMFNYHW